LLNNAIVGLSRERAAEAFAFETTIAEWLENDPSVTAGRRDVTVRSHHFAGAY
jgi:hypothetical protein